MQCRHAGHDAAAAALLALSPGAARQAEKESYPPQTALDRLAQWGGTGEKGEQMPLKLMCKSFWD